jgi:8-oxo-dGTP diphosphatase
MTTALPNVRVGVAVMIVRDQQVLLQLRGGPLGQSTWATPGGHLDHGETPEECAVRETQEEIGVDLNIDDLEFVGITNDQFVDLQKHYITLWFVARKFRGEPQIVSPREVRDLGWFDWDALPQPLFMPFQHVISGDTLPPRVIDSLKASSTPAAFNDER